MQQIFYGGVFETDFINEKALLYHLTTIFIIASCGFVYTFLYLESDTVLEISDAVFVG